MPRLRTLKARYTDDAVTVYHGDCIKVMRGLPDNSVDAVVTDPPYALEFMGKDWDSFTPRAFQQWCEEWGREALRVLKPGGHILAFGGSRTYHRLASGLEDAGFEVRDSIMWIYGSGFPKSRHIGKEVDRHLGAKREVVGQRTDGRYKHGFSDAAKKALGKTVADESDTGFTGTMGDITMPATDEGAEWEGWGTALKPAHEPIVVGRKPFRGTIAANVLEWQVGALNIDGCRVGTGDDIEPVHSTRTVDYPQTREPGSGDAGWGRSRGGLAGDEVHWEPAAGRWPPNVIFDEFMAEQLDQQTGNLKPGGNLTGAEPSSPFGGAVYNDMDGREAWQAYGDKGGASRYFPIFRYEPKAGRSERDTQSEVRNDHPTVKPVELMRWLIRLVAKPGATILEPFAGSGTTAEAAVIEGMHCVAIEKHGPYLPIIEARLSKPIELDLFGAARFTAPPPRDPDEPSAQRRYSDEGAVPFAMTPGPRYDRRNKPPSIDVPLLDEEEA